MKSLPVNSLQSAIHNSQSATHNDFPAAVFAILFQPSQLRFQQRGLNSRSGNCLMNNRARAKRAFDVTLFLLLVLTSSFGQVLFKTRQERPRVNSDAAEQAGAPALPEVYSIATQEGASGLPGAGQQARRNIGAFFDKLRAG